VTPVGPAKEKFPLRVRLPFPALYTKEFVEVTPSTVTVPPRAKLPSVSKKKPLSVSVKEL